MLDLIVVGFPKCGTTALLREIGKSADAHVLQTPSGSLEYAWPRFRDTDAMQIPGKIRAHKYSAYVYSGPALRFLAENHGSATLTVCVRSTKATLISWHRMHQRIAQDGKNVSHFAYREREFYSNCTLEDYYRRYAQERLRYQEHLSRLMKTCPANPIVVVAQEFLARNMSQFVAALVASVSSGERLVKVDASDSGARHVSYAENADAELSDEIVNELAVNDSLLAEFLKSSGVQCFL